MTTKHTSHKRRGVTNLKPAKGRRLWREMHDGKIAHTDENEARDHRDMMNSRHALSYCYYQCRYGDSYEHGSDNPLHWHVGRARGWNP